MMDDGAFEDEEEEFDDDDERYVPTLQQTLSKLRSRRDAARENKHGLRSSALFFAENCCVMSSALVKFVVKKKKKKKMKMKNERFCDDDFDDVRTGKEIGRVRVRVHSPRGRATRASDGNHEEEERRKRRKQRRGKLFRRVRRDERVSQSVLV